MSASGSTSAGRSAQHPPVLRAYRRLALAFDAGAALAAVGLALASGVPRGSVAQDALAAVLLPASWLLLLGAQRSYEWRFLGSGPEEYRRLGRGALLLVAAVSVAVYLLRVDLSRRTALGAVATTFALSVIGRHLLRTRLYRARRAGGAMHRVLVLGRADAARVVIDRLARLPEQGLAVVGVCLPDDSPAVRDGKAQAEPGSFVVHPAIEGVPVLGTGKDVVRLAADVGADAVAVVSHPDLSGQSLRRLAWALESRRVDLFVVPGIVEVAGARLSIRPIAGLSLLHLQRPDITGGRLLLKLVGDRVVAATVLLLTLPATAGLALALLGSRRRLRISGSPRVGLAGRPFNLLSFDLPRAGRVAAVSRRLHLDELPALVNVLRGEMSLVGPRAAAGSRRSGASSLARTSSTPLPTAARTMRVRPGVSGLWRLTEATQLSSEEVLSMDLHYVDNWSVTLDVVILLRTARALAAGSLASEPASAQASVPVTGTRRGLQMARS